ncbi:MAG: ankyrin repeat domain-containing protein [Rickettsiaceae bacterium]|nr:ankyrin repeat domain-containing protein [Rickettsiaceae bacterium]
MEDNSKNTLNEAVAKGDLQAVKEIISSYNESIIDCVENAKLINTNWWIDTQELSAKSRDTEIKEFLGTDRLAVFNASLKELFEKKGLGPVKELVSIYQGKVSSQDMQYKVVKALGDAMRSYNAGDISEALKKIIIKGGEDFGLEKVAAGVVYEELNKIDKAVNKNYAVKSLKNAQSFLGNKIDLMNEALTVAIEKSNSKVVQSLVENGANINLPNKNGKTPLLVAIEKKDVEMTKLLIKNGADVDKEKAGFAKDNKGIENDFLQKVMKTEKSLMSQGINKVAMTSIAIAAGLRKALIKNNSLAIGNASGPTEPPHNEKKSKSAGRSGM